MTRAFIALGSNLGDRSATIAEALLLIDSTEGIDLVNVSSVIETEPVGPPGQGPYLNAVCEAGTVLSARELLERLLSIEAAMGRDRSSGERWGARTLDLDVLLFGERVISEPGLEVPHPRLADRLFVLEPLAEIAPAVLVPGLGRTVRELLDALLHASEDVV